MTARHKMFDGKLQVYRRTATGPWHSAARLGGHRFRRTTGEAALDRAKDIAEEWYLDLRGKLRSGALGEPVRTREKAFGAAAEAYLAEARVLATDVRSPRYIDGVEQRLNARILPFFRDQPLSKVTKALVQAYRVQRIEETIARTAVAGKDGAPDVPGRPPAPGTLLQEIVVIRQVLKHAETQGWIAFVPSLSMPFMKRLKKVRRAWFSHAEYDRLHKATAKKVKDCDDPELTPVWANLHDFVLIMANTGLRPDEAWRLEFRDVAIEDDYATKQTILVIDVRGKTGVGYCKSMPNAVHPFERLRGRRIAAMKAEGLDDEEIARRLPSEIVFPDYDRGMFNEILEAENLKTDRDGQRRTAYSLRHTYISMRLMEGANIHAIANNCRTSVQMIEDFYAAHIKDRIDASAVNIMRPRAARRGLKGDAGAGSPGAGPGQS